MSRTDELKGKMKEKIEEHADSAILSKKLATIFREVPLEQSLDEMAFTGLNEETAGPALAKLEFKSLIERLNLSTSGAAGDAAESKPQAKIDVTLVDATELPRLRTIWHK